MMSTDSALTPSPSPNPGRGEKTGVLKPPLSQNWERGLGGEGGSQQRER
jgi:hypothetical protein